MSASQTRSGSRRPTPATSHTGTPAWRATAAAAREPATAMKLIGPGDRRLEHDQRRPPRRRRRARREEPRSRRRPACSRWRTNGMRPRRRRRPRAPRRHPDGPRRRRPRRPPEHQRPCARRQAPRQAPRRRCRPRSPRRRPGPRRAARRRTACASTATTGRRRSAGGDTIRRQAVTRPDGSSSEAWRAPGRLADQQLLRGAPTTGPRSGGARSGARGTTMSLVADPSGARLGGRRSAPALSSPPVATASRRSRAAPARGQGRAPWASSSSCSTWWWSCSTRTPTRARGCSRPRPHPRNFAGADCRAAFVLTVRRRGRTRVPRPARRTSLMASSTRTASFVKALGLRELPAFVHLAHRPARRRAGRGVGPRDLAADRREPGRHDVVVAAGDPAAGDPVPYAGTPARLSHRVAGLTQRSVQPPSTASVWPVT